MNLIYHYTTLDIFKRMLKQGAIRPDRNEPQNENEIPTVTFSADQEWERTRFRVGRLPDGQLLMLNKLLLEQFCGGLIRIGVKPEIAPMDWHEMKDSVGLSKEAMKGIYDFALSVGAHTSHWFATFESVPEEEWMCVQLLKNNEWVDLQENEIPNLDDVNLDEPIGVVEIKFDKPGPQDVSSISGVEEPNMESVQEPALKSIS